MLFLGFSAGIPILLIFSSLSLWLREAGVERAAVTFFSWAALGYSFKFVWAPLVDRLPIPWLTRWLGRRRSWMLLAQSSIIGAILWMAFTNPVEAENSMTLMAFAAVFLGFSSATQDVVIDAYRIESADSDLQAMMSSTYIAGYRIGMLVAGAGALFLASYLGSEMGSYHYHAWRWTYIAMAGVMLVGVITTLTIPEPDIQKKSHHPHRDLDYLHLFLLFLCAITGFIATFYVSTGIVSTSKNFLTSIFNNPYLASFLMETLRLI
ncbi:MAG TPA: MFS transporter, partial [Gammaproteobacteria bacterium]|nr:MFS transporter [Gammaproteobacteria bacterium]